jgi:cytochrome c
MFDTMTLTKIASGLFGAWLVLLVGKWAGEEIYHAESHGEQSYVIEVAEAETEEAEEVDLATLMASADASNGEKVFRKCSACHKVEQGENGVGPYLYAVVNREIAAVDGFGYSGALSGIEGVWDYEALYAFLEKPSGYAPGTSMGFAGLKKQADRVDVIAYLESLGN